MFDCVCAGRVGLSCQGLPQEEHSGVLQCVAVCCSILHCVAISCMLLQNGATRVAERTKLLYMCEDTQWRGCVGCIMLQVSVRKRATNYRALMQKMTYTDKVSYTSLPPSPVYVCFELMFSV